MKKFFRGIALLVLPLFVYYIAFFAFEPNNYLGIQPWESGGSPIGVLREYRNNPHQSIILGDSRLAHFDMQLANSVAGRSFSNLAYGGASLRENLDLLDNLLLEQPDINEVIFGISFYTLNKEYDENRMKVILQSLDNPFAYMTSLSYNLLAIQNMQYFLQGQALGGGQQEIRSLDEYSSLVSYTIPETGETFTYQDFFVEYSTEKISAYTSVWQPNNSQFSRLLKTIEKCEAAGVRFVVVLPPVHDSVVHLAINPNGIDTAMLPMIQQLKQSSASLVLDYEFTMRPNFEDTQFYDGFHLEYKRGLSLFLNMLFTDIK